MRTIFIVPVLLAAFAAPAWASQCPRSIAALDDMLRQHGSMLSPDKATAVTALRNKAEQAHAAGKHDESPQAVQHARSAIGMSRLAAGQARSLALAFLLLQHGAPSEPTAP